MLTRGLHVFLVVSFVSSWLMQRMRQGRHGAKLKRTRACSRPGVWIRQKITGVAFSSVTEHHRLPRHSVDSTRLVLVTSSTSYLWVFGGIYETSPNEHRNLDTFLTKKVKHHEKNSLDHEDFNSRSGAADNYYPP